MGPIIICWVEQMNKISKRHQSQCLTHCVYSINTTLWIFNKYNHKISIIIGWSLRSLPFYHQSSKTWMSRDWAYIQWTLEDPLPRGQDRVPRGVTAPVDFPSSSVIFSHSLFPRREDRTLSSGLGVGPSHFKLNCFWDRPCADINPKSSHQLQKRDRLDS